MSASANCGATRQDGRVSRQVSAIEPQDEVATLVSELIRIDTSNYGTDEGPGEIEAADYCLQRLTEAGIEARRFHTTAQNRAGVIARIGGRNPARPALLVHGHLDVVPAPEPDWKYPPFAGVIDSEGMLWGRGAVDMKNMVGMVLAVVRSWARNRIKPERDLVLLFLPDEEAGCIQGSHWLIRHRRDMFEGITEAVGEVGGFSTTLDGRYRLYPIMTAEKGIVWVKLIATGVAGHGSLLAVDNAVHRISAVANGIANHQFEPHITATVRAFLDVVAEVSGEPLDINDSQSLARRLGSMGRVIESTVRDTAQVTMLEAGFKHNVIPESASACVDARFLPGAGETEALLSTFKQLAGEQVRFELVHHDIAIEAKPAGPIMDAMTAALRSQDPEAIPVPYLMSGGTDAKALSLVGISCYGFSPLRLPESLDFFGMFHAVNERVPVDALKFGVKVLDNFLRRA